MGEVLHGCVAKRNPDIAEGGKPVRTGRWQIMINGES